MALPLEHGHALLDLYFLDSAEIAWYAGLLRENPDVTPQDPHEFVAGLTSAEMGTFAKVLTRGLTQCFRGRLVGRRPRFGALATYFPDLGNANHDKRLHAVKALRNTVRLARLLGCHCVEIVGGPRSGPNSDTQMGHLADAICEIYDPRAWRDPEVPFELPPLCVELEPGPGFLVQDLEMFRRLRRAVLERAGDLLWLPGKCLLNIDVAHAFIIGYGPSALTAEESEDPHHSEDLTSVVGHMHVSDHAAGEYGGSHESDLAPGAYHQFQDEYRPWIELAVLLAGASEKFSGIISVELEARNDLGEVLAATHTVRRWISVVAGTSKAPVQPDSSQLRERHGRFRGALVVFDLGNSTPYLTRESDFWVGSRDLEQKVAQLCEAVQDRGGSVMSFTGDGLIALFEERFGRDPHDVARQALEAAVAATEVVGAARGLQRQTSRNVHALSIRAALHWGDAYVPTSGRLRDQIMGPEVVLATRLCDFLGRVVEECVPLEHGPAVVAMTGEFRGKLDVPPREHGWEWSEIAAQRFKGLDHRLVSVFVRQRRVQGR